MSVDEKKIGDLTEDARESLKDLLEFGKPKVGRSSMRLTVDGKSTGWEILTSDSVGNITIIRERIEACPSPPTDLVLAFVGLIELRGRKRLMARMQYFRADYPSGLLFGSHLKKRFFGLRLRAHGKFLVFGGYKNTWI